MPVQYLSSRSQLQVLQNFHRWYPARAQSTRPVSQPHHHLIQEIRTGLRAQVAACMDLGHNQSAVAHRKPLLLMYQVSVARPAAIWRAYRTLVQHPEGLIKPSYPVKRQQAPARQPQGQQLPESRSVRPATVAFLPLSPCNQAAAAMDPVVSQRIQAFLGTAGQRAQAMTTLVLRASPPWALTKHRLSASTAFLPQPYFRLGST